MKNRALEIAMLQGVRNIGDLANRLNCSLDDAASIINEKEIAPDLLDKFLKEFKVTKEYFYCITEVNNYECL